MRTSGGPTTARARKKTAGCCRVPPLARTIDILLIIHYICEK